MATTPASTCGFARRIAPAACRRSGRVFCARGAPPHGARDPQKRTPPRGRGRGKGRSRIGRGLYWGVVLALWAADRRRRHDRLGRHPSAADPVARNTEAAAVDSHPRAQRRDARHARRHGRRRGVAARTAGLRAARRSSPSRTAASIPPRRRSVGHPARRHPDVLRRGRRARRLDHHPAARQESVPDPGAHDLAQAAGAGARVLARAQIQQGGNSRALSQPRLFRRRRLRRRRGGAALFRQIGAAVDARRSGDAGGPRAIAVAAGAEPQSRRRRTPRARRHRRHGGRRS